jgi:hypothetical protein
MMPVSAARLEQRDGEWQLDESLRLDPEWHGASVVAMKDGYLVGVLIHERPAHIASVPSELLSP